MKEKYDILFFHKCHHDTNTVTNSVTIALNFEFKTLAIFDVESFKTYVTVENLQSDVISGLLKMRKCLPI